MLWSLVKIILFVVVVAAAALGASYLMDLQGGVRVAVSGWEFNLTPLKAVIALILLAAAVWIVVKLLQLVYAVLRFINGDETAISRYFDRNSQKKGLQALSDSLIALSAGEGRLALAKAKRAEKYLDRPELTALLTAQAADLTGDKAKREAAYKKLLTDEKTKFTGIRGMIRLKLEQGDTDTAMKLAEKALTLKPGHVEVQDTLLQLQAGKQDWQGARNTLKTKLRTGSLPKDVHKRRDAVLALSEAKAILDENNSIEAREAAIEANRLSPDLIPAACFAARAYHEQDRNKLATRVLKKAWDASPHPDLAATFAALVPDETPQERLKRFQALTKIHPEHRETRLLLAELLIAAEDFPAARKALGDLVTKTPDARVLTIMAAIERGEGSPDAIVKGWLTRAVSAPRGPAWTCENCGHVHAQWGPVCDNCGAFDTLAWKDAPAAEYQTPMAQHMLPLIVGRIDEATEAAATSPAPAPDVPDAEVLSGETTVGSVPEADAGEARK